MAHLHDVIDTDLHFIIDPETRSISHASEEPVRLIQGDHNSEIFTFEVPKYIDGHDTSLCNKVQVHFINISGSDPNLTSPGLYEVPIEDVQALEGSDDKLVFPWLIAHEATEYIGTLNFAVRFMCTTSTTDEEGNNIVVKDYVWNTSPYTGVLISEGIDQEDAIITQYYNTIDAWIQTISTEGELAAEVVETAKVNAVDAVSRASSQQMAKSKSEIDKYADEVKSKIATNTVREYLETTVVEETGASADLVMSQKGVTDALNNLESEVGVKCANMLSAANERCTEVEADLASTKTHVQQSPRADGSYKLEVGKTYYIHATGYTSFNDSHPFYPSQRTWPVVLKCIVNGWYYSGDQQVCVNTDEVLPMPDHRDHKSPTTDIDGWVATGPDSYGFYIRIFEDGTPKTSFTAEYEGTTMSRVSYEIWSSIDNHRYYSPIAINIDGDSSDDNTDLDFNINTFHTTDAGVYIWPMPDETYDSPAFAYDFNNYDYGDGLLGVYEVRDITSGPTVKIEANGISTITKTGTSGNEDYYLILLDDGTKVPFTVTNGVGIRHIARTGSSDHEDRYTIFLDNGAGFYFYIPNANTVGIRTPASGPVIHAEDVIPFTTHTVKTKARSRNLISYPYPSSSGEVNGITFTDNGDGSIKVVGTTEEGFFASFKLADISSSLEDGKTYRVTGSNALLLAYKNENGTVKYVKQDTITWSKDYEFVQLYLQYQSSNGAIDETVYPIVCLSDEGTDYTPYVDLTTTKLSVCGKNMFDPSKLLKATGWTKVDGAYSGSPHAAYLYYGNAEGGIPLLANFEPGVPYTLSLEGYADLDADKTISVIFRFVYTDESYDSLQIDTTEFTKKTLTSDPAKTIKGVYMSYAHNAKPYIRNIQLEKGATATEYEPYSGDTYAIDSIGLPSSIVYAKSPTMTLFTDKRGVMLDATYNVDQTAAYNKFVAKVEALLNGGA